MEWVDPEDAIEVNLSENRKNKAPDAERQRHMMEREACVLKLLTEEDKLN